MNKRFTIEGAVLHREDLLRVKQAYEHNRLLFNMRKEGFVPVLDIEPDVQFEYLEGKGTWKYTVGMVGQKIGSKSWAYEGILKDIGLIRSSPRSK